MPLLRYDTGDITFIINEKCSCGRITQRIGPILGRTKSIIKISGVTFSQIQLENVILSTSYVNDYCIVIRKNNDGIQCVNIYISSMEKKNNQMIQNIKQNIWESIRITTEVIYCDINKLKEIQTSTDSRKPLRFIDQSNKDITGENK